MRQLIPLFLVFLSALSSSDPATDADVAEIEALYVTWRAAVTSGDIPQYVSVLHPAVRMIPPGAEVVDSAASYEDFLQPVFTSATYKIQVDRPVRVDIAGDIAVAEYDYTIYLTLKDPEQQITEPGALTGSVNSARYFDVLKKNADGRWKIWRHTWQGK